MAKIVIAGGGWSGAAAAVRAVKRGHHTVLCEKTDMLLGLGNVGGIMRNNGRFTAAEENIALGAGELFEITDSLSIHRNVDFPKHAHASFYDVSFAEPEVRRLLLRLGVEIRLMTRITDVLTDGADGDCRHSGTSADAGDRVARKVDGAPVKIKAFVTADGETIDGDVFVETTGSTGPMGNCARYGNGCSMCVLRCPSFGPRVSLTERAGMKDVFARKDDGTVGAFSGSCKLEKRTLSPEIREKLDRDGVVVVPLPKELINREKLAKKVCRQYAHDAYAENVILIDTGHAKLMTPYFDLSSLRRVKGFENVRFIDPYAGGKGNSVRYMSVGLRDDTMRARQVSNLFLGGEKSGFFIGHTEAMTTGSLAGFNAARLAEGKEPLALPKTLAAGALLDFAQRALEGEDGLDRRFTFAGGEFFDYMKENGLYSVSPEAIRSRVEAAGLTDVYNRMDM